FGDYPQAAAGPQGFSAVDNSAPANAKVVYSVKASHFTTIQGLPGTPSANKTITVPTLMQTSNLVTVTTPALPPAVVLRGWADLHTHLMSTLAFAGKLFHGAPDEGSLLPAVQMLGATQCEFDVTAGTPQRALGDDAVTHGDHAQTPACGDDLRKALIWKLEDG